MVEPTKVAGNHDIFICGNDESAKSTVLGILESFGWRTIHDMGDISAARGTEQMMPIWLRLWQSFGHANFNYRIVVND